MIQKSWNAPTGELGLLGLELRKHVGGVEGNGDRSSDGSRAAAGCGRCFERNSVGSIASSDGDGVEGIDRSDGLLSVRGALSVVFVLPFFVVLGPILVLLYTSDSKFLPFLCRENSEPKTS